ncbi:MAG: circularly permuted type 2 ATP-grasp protein, partial [bacterium]
MQSLLEQYEYGAGYDEMFQAPGVPRAHCRAVFEALCGLTEADIIEARQRADLAFVDLGITFTVYSESEGIERIFPFDLVPRIIAAAEWRMVEQGLKQRLLALNAFLQDVYNEGKIIAAGLIPGEAVYSSPNFRPEMRGFTPPSGAWIHIAGIDLVRDADGTIYVLEDNARTPSGVSYVLQNRSISTRILPRLFERSDVVPVGDYANRLHAAVRACFGPDPAVVLTPGMYNSAYFEHSFLAKQMGVQLV